MATRKEYLVQLDQRLDVPDSLHASGSLKCERNAGRLTCFSMARLHWAAEEQITLYKVLTLQPALNNVGDAWFLQSLEHSPSNYVRLH